MKGKDITGQFFGDFQAIRPAYTDNSGHRFWKCQCPNCGKIKFGTVYSLEHGRMNLKCSCGGLYSSPSYGSQDNEDDEDFFAPISDEDYRDAMGVIDTNSSGDDFASQLENIPVSTSTKPITYSAFKVDGSPKSQSEITKELEKIYQNGSYEDFMRALFGPTWVNPNNSQDDVNEDDYDEEEIYVTDYHDYLTVINKDGEDILNVPNHVIPVIGINTKETWQYGLASKFNEVYNFPIRNSILGTYRELGRVCGLTLYDGRKKTNYNILKQSLDDFISGFVFYLFDYYEGKNVYIAFPMLGCNGKGLEKNKVKKMIVDAFKDEELDEYCNDLNVKINVYLYDPNPDEP